MTNPTHGSSAARLRAELVEARQRRADVEHRWAVARYTSSTADRPEDLDVELARLDATIADREEALAAIEPAPGSQTAADTPPQDSPAKAPSRHQDRLSGAGGYLASSPPAPAQPERTPNAEPD